MSPRAGIGKTWSRGPACGDATVEPIIRASHPILRASSGSDPQGGPSSALRRAPLSGDATKAIAAGHRHQHLGHGTLTKEVAA